MFDACIDGYDDCGERDCPRSPTMPSDKDDAAVLRRAAEILDGISHGYSVMTNNIRSEANKLEEPPPKTFTLEFTNADPRPFTDEDEIIATRQGVVASVDHREDYTTFSSSHRNLFTAVRDDEPWPQDLYWARLPEEPDDVD